MTLLRSRPKTKFRTDAGTNIRECHSALNKNAALIAPTTTKTTYWAFNLKHISGGELITDSFSQPTMEMC